MPWLGSKSWGSHPIAPLDFWVQGDTRSHVAQFHPGSEAPRPWPQAAQGPLRAGAVFRNRIQPPGGPAARQAAVGPEFKLISTHSMAAQGCPRALNFPPLSFHSRKGGWGPPRSGTLPGPDSPHPHGFVWLPGGELRTGPAGGRALLQLPGHLQGAAGVGQERGPVVGAPQPSASTHLAWKAPALSDDVPRPPRWEGDVCTQSLGPPGPQHQQLVCSRTPARVHATSRAPSAELQMPLESVLELPSSACTEPVTRARGPPGDVRRPGRIERRLRGGFGPRWGAPQQGRHRAAWGASPERSESHTPSPQLLLCPVPLERATRPQTSGHVEDRLPPRRPPGRLAEDSGFHVPLTMSAQWALSGTQKVPPSWFRGSPTRSSHSCTTGEPEDPPLSPYVTAAAR